MSLENIVKPYRELFGIRLYGDVNLPESVVKRVAEDAKELKVKIKEIKSGDLLHKGYSAAFSDLFPEILKIDTKYSKDPVLATYLVYALIGMQAGKKYATLFALKKVKSILGLRKAIYAWLKV